MPKNALFLSMFLPVTNFLSQPVEIQFETGSDIQLCSSILHKYKFVGVFLSQGLWETIPPFPKILGDTNTEALASASVLNVAGISCISPLVFFFQFYPSTLNVSLEMILSDS